MSLSQEPIDADIETDDNSGSDNLINFPETENISGQGKEVELRFLVKKYHSNVKYTSYFQEMGISDDLVDKYNLGFDKEDNAIVIPRYKKDNPVAIKKMWLYSSDKECYTIDHVDYFNIELLDSDVNPIFVTKSIIDALRIEETIGDPAIAIQDFRYLDNFLSKSKEQGLNNTSISFQIIIS